MNENEASMIKKVRFTDRIGLPALMKNLPRTLNALNFTLTLSTFMTAMQAVADNRAISAGLHRQADEPLPDFLMDLASAAIPMHMADLLLNSLIFFSISMFLVSWRWRIQQYGTEEGHYRTLRIARKFFWMLGFAYLFRSLSLLSTTMPPTDPRCVYKQRNWKQIPFMAFEIMTKQGNTCSDKVFSGHSSMATLVGLFWLGALLRPDRGSSESPKSKVPLWRKAAAFFISIWVLSVYIFCVLCRNHYSIDIVVAILVCTGIFSTYQLCVRVIELVKSSTDEGQVFASSSNASLPAYNITYLNPSKTTSIIYSPIKHQDPELALESPTIAMNEITSPHLTANEKPSDFSKEPTEPPSKIPYAPRLFVRMLRVVAWMDGFDLKP